MAFLKELFFLLYPYALLEGTHLRPEWNVIAKTKFLRRVSWLLGIGSLAYIFHYPFVDLPAGKKPEELWFEYRFGMALLALVTLAWYRFVPVARLKYSKFPAFLAFASFNYFQGQTMIWHIGTPFFFSFVMAATLAIILGETMLTNLILFTIFIGLHIEPMLITEVPHHAIISYTVMFYGIIVLVASSYKADIQIFLSERKIKDTEQKNIQMTIEFSNLIQSFLPKEIVKRYQSVINRGHTSSLNALQEVLQRKKVSICCVYSDIRNYTQKSKDLSRLNEDMLDEIRVLHKPIEDFGGIPRKIGDLIFAYFDGARLDNNILKAICASIEAFDQHIVLTEKNRDKIERRFVITSGESICGNIGLFDSMIEITALGSPVNLAARIDELTKKDAIKNILNRADLILSSHTYMVLADTVPKLQFRKIDLREISCDIRDFPEEKEIYLLPATLENYTLIINTIANAMSLNENISEAG